MLKVKIKLTDDGKMPEKKHTGDACFDCYAKIANGSLKIPQGSRCLISLGFCLELPQGFEAIVRPRSGLTMQGLDSAIGTIDGNYRGEVKACIINNTGGDYTINKGERICQLAIRKTEDVTFELTEELADSERGEAGFGSTGV